MQPIWSYEVLSASANDAMGAAAYLKETQKSARCDELEQTVYPLGYWCKEGTMTLLRWALIALLLSLVAGLLGFTNLSVASAEAARIFFYIFIVLFVILLVLGLTIFRAAHGP